MRAEAPVYPHPVPVALRLPCPRLLPQDTLVRDAAVQALRSLPRSQFPPYSPAARRACRHLQASAMRLASAGSKASYSATGDECSIVGDSPRGPGFRAPRRSSFIIKRAPRAGRARQARFLHLLFAGLIQADENLVVPIGTLVDLQHVLHGADKFRTALRRNAPTLFQPRLEFVFFRSGAPFRC